MPGSTPRYGIPYSTGADGVHTIDQTMQALADRVDLLLGETGSDTITAAGAGTVSKRITYARTYPADMPIPRATIQQSTNHADSIFIVDGEDRTGFTVTLRTSSAGTATRTFRWLARVVS